MEGKAVPNRQTEPALSAEARFALEVGRQAEHGLAAGLYCAESVVQALAQAQGIDSDMLPMMATAFCGGMARTCGTCGALTGAVMGVSLALGRSGPGESAEAAYAATQLLVRSFEQEFGARNCDQLLGCDLGSAEGQAIFHDEQLHQRCARYTRRAAELAAALICPSRKR